MVPLAMGASLLAGVAAATAQAATRQAPVNGGTLNLGFTSDIHTLDPVQLADTQSIVPGLAIYNTLLTYNAKSQVVPELAQRWKVENGGKTYILYLRHGVRFSDGAAFTSQDVIDEFVRDITPSNADPYSGALSAVVGYAAFQKHPKGVPAGLKALGPYAVEINLTEPQGFFLNVLTLVSVSGIPDPAMVKKWGAAYTNHPVGTGPFMLKNYTPEHSLTLVPNPYYWGPKPHLAAVNMYFNLQPNTALLEFERGQLDAVPAAEQFELPPSMYLTAMANPTLRKDYYRAPVIGISIAFMNEQLVPQFKNVLVRQAINYAVSKQQLIARFNNRGLPATQVLPPGMPGYEKNLKGYPYNLQKARQLLKQAGYAKGFSVTYWTPTDTDYLDPAEVIQSDLARVGIKVTLKTMTLGAYETALSANKVTFGPEYWTEDYPDPQDFLFYMLDPSGINGAGNFANWVDPKFAQLERRANALPASEDALRYRLYDEAQNIAVQQAPWLFMWFPVQDMLISPKLEPSPRTHLDLYLNPNLPMALGTIWKQ
jgi:oligopeptide transport system substrate-binding protein